MSRGTTVAGELYIEPFGVSRFIGVADKAGTAVGAARTTETAAAVSGGLPGSTVGAACASGGRAAGQMAVAMGDRMRGLRDQAQASLASYKADDDHNADALGTIQSAIL